MAVLAPMPNARDRTAAKARPGRRRNIRRPRRRSLSICRNLSQGKGQRLKRQKAKHEGRKPKAEEGKFIAKWAGGLSARSPATGRFRLDLVFADGHPMF